MSAPRLLDYLDHIDAAIQLAETIVQQSDQRAFVAGQLPLHDAAAVRQVEIIGEAVSQIRERHPELLVEHPEVPWSAMSGMRNRLIHGYFGVDLNTVWQTVARDLPALRLQLLRVRQTAERLAPRS